MKSFFLKIFAVGLLCISNFVQTPTPTPTPPTDSDLIVDDDEVVKISTNLIQLDVTVTDQKGRIVTDLKPEDFEIYENGKKQNLTNFKFIAAQEDQSFETKKSNIKDSKDSIPIPTAKIKPQRVRRTIALVVDDIGLSFESTYYVKRALKKFVNEQMQPGDLVAIIRTAGGIGALQQFSSDKKMLLAAIERVNWKSYGSGGILPFAPIKATPLERAKANGAEITDEMLEAEKDLINSSNDFRANSFTTGTLGAVNYIIRGMKDLPGRKSIMLMSDGFELLTTGKDDFRNSGRVLESLKQLVDLANRSSVVVYTMDPRGLQTLGGSSEDDNFALSAQEIEQKLSDRRDEFFNTQEGLVYLAKQTGGFPIVNQNDLSGGIRKVLNDQSYYLIGYEPDDTTFNPINIKFNNLEIKVKRSNVNVRYRSGFLGVTDEKMEKPKNRTPYEQITEALTSPFAVNDINLNLNTLFRSDEKNNYSINSYLYISIKDLQFTDEPNNMKKAVFDLLAMSFGDNGVPLDQISKTYTVNIKEENYQKLLKEGFVYNFTFPIKKAGAYQMRVAIRDHATEKVGSSSQFIEVPKLNKRRLTLSGIVVENLSRELWEKGDRTTPSNSQLKTPDPVSDTALLAFKRNTVLRYGFEIYNAKANNRILPKLNMKTRVFHNGNLIFEGKPKSIDTDAQKNSNIIGASGAINIGTDMQTGDYILQVIITDEHAKEKYQTVAQVVQFEVIE